MLFFFKRDIPHLLSAFKGDLQLIDCFERYLEFVDLAFLYFSRYAKYFHAVGENRYFSAAAIVIGETGRT